VPYLLDLASLVGCQVELLDEKGAEFSGRPVTCLSGDAHADPAEESKARPRTGRGIFSFSIHGVLRSARLPGRRRSTGRTARRGSVAGSAPAPVDVRRRPPVGRGPEARSAAQRRPIHPSAPRPFTPPHAQHHRRGDGRAPEETGSRPACGVEFPRFWRVAPVGRREPPPRSRQVNFYNPSESPAVPPHRFSQERRCSSTRTRFVGGQLVISAYASSRGR